MDNFFNDNDDMLIDDEDDTFVQSSRAALRRKNDWKHAQRRNDVAARKNLLKARKPLHYYSKNNPWNSYAFAPNKTNNKGSRRYISKNYASQKNWNEHDKRQIQDFENQVNELFDSN